METRPLKILTLQFRALGDTVMSIPALMAIRERHPDCELHALVAERAVPLLRHHPVLNRVWGFPSARGRVRPGQGWPIVRALRAERFDRSVDFSGNDRSAILSLLCGARERLGVLRAGGFFGRRFCYTRTVSTGPAEQHEASRLLSVLEPWGIRAPSRIEIQLFTDPALVSPLRREPGERMVICHVGAGISKKEWPITHWAQFHQLAKARGYSLVFDHGVGTREDQLARALQTLAPGVRMLPPLGLADFLATLKSADAIISCDTGPIHFAAGLGVKIIALFGPTSVTKWSPVGADVRILQTKNCACDAASHHCHSAKHCLAEIQPGAVLEQLENLLSVNPAPNTVPRERSKSSNGLS